MFKKILASVIIGISMFAGVSQAVMSYSYSDVNTDTDYFNSIYWAAEQGIATGYGNGMWGPDECVRRAELVKMVLEYMGYGSGVQPLYMNYEEKFSDISEEDWYYNYVMHAELQGYIEGYSDGTFRPNACVNRVEAMKIVAEVLIEEEFNSYPTGGLYYDNKLIVDVEKHAWYMPYAYYLFENRLVGTSHTGYAGDIAGVYTINFFPGESMTRKEVAEMMNRISKHLELDK